MNHEHQTRVEHFATLKSKYKATDYEDSSPASLLYLILRKADLGIQIIEVEVIWLIDHQLLQTLKVVREQYRQREKELKQLENEFEQLTYKYTTTTFHDTLWENIMTDKFGNDRISVLLGDSEKINQALAKVVQDA